MKVIKSFLVLIILQISCGKKNSVVLSVETENSTESTNYITVCETEGGFEIGIDEDFKNKIYNKKAKRILLIGNNKKIEIGLFNILYSSKTNVEHQSPLTPKGKVFIFKDGKDYFIDVKSKNKTAIKNLFKDKIEECKRIDR